MPSHSPSSSDDEEIVAFEEVLETTGIHPRFPWRQTSANVASMVITACVGVATRILLVQTSTHAAQDLVLLGVDSIFANVLGCFVLGVAVRWRYQLQRRHECLFLGVTSGFAGSCTTFSAWIVHLTWLLVRRQWFSCILSLLVGFICGIASYRCGYTMGDAIVRSLANAGFRFDKLWLDLHILHSDIEACARLLALASVSTAPDPQRDRLMATLQDHLDHCRVISHNLLQESMKMEARRNPGIALLWVALGLLTWAVVWALAFVGIGDRQFQSHALAVAVGPFGALLRYRLAVFNQRPWCRDFPFFTFIVNVLSSALAMLATLALANRDFVMTPVVVGFCGALSTFSTWIHEIEMLSARRSRLGMRYAIVSVLTSVLLALTIQQLERHLPRYHHP